MGVLLKNQFVLPVETRLAQGYTNQDMIGEIIAPRMLVSKRYGKYAIYGKEAFKVYDSKRATSGKTKRLDFSFDTAEYSIPYTHSLEAPIDDEEDEATTGVSQINLITQSRMILQSSLSIERELEIATLVTDVSKYGTSHAAVATKWDNLAANIFGDIKDANEVIRSKIGTYGDTLVVTAKTWADISMNTALLEKIKYTQTGILTEKLLASLLGIKQVIVGLGIYYDEANGVNVDLWGSSFAALIKTGAPAGTGVIDPSRLPPGFAYTLQVQGYPKVLNYRDETIESTIVKVKDAWKTLQTSTEAGYFFETLV